MTRKFLGGGGSRSVEYASFFKAFTAQAVDSFVYSDWTLGDAWFADAVDNPIVPTWIGINGTDDIEVTGVGVYLINAKTSVEFSGAGRARLAFGVSSLFGSATYQAEDATSTMQLTDAQTLLTVSDAPVQLVWSAVLQPISGTLEFVNGSNFSVQIVKMT